MAADVWIVAGAGLLKPADELVRHAFIDAGQQAILEPLDAGLHEHQQHRQRKCRGRVVERDAQAVRDLGHRLFQRLRVQIGHGDRDADDRAEQTENRNRPDDDPDHRIGRVDADRLDFFQVAQVRFQRVGRVLAADEVERIAQATHNDTFR